MAGVEQYGGAGGAILDEPFGPSWASDVMRGRSAKSIYDEVSSIGNGFGNTAYVRTQGNDTTGQIGNYLRPFQTPGAAIAALGTLPNSTLWVDAGYYILNDFNAPYGLKAPGGLYDVYLAIGCTIDYRGTYGIFITSAADRTCGSLYGYGYLINNGTATKAVSGVAGYPINVERQVPLAGSKTLEVLQADQNSAGVAGLVRIGDCNTQVTSYNIIAHTRMRSKKGTVIFLDSNSRSFVTGEGSFDSIEGFPAAGANDYAVQITNPQNAEFRRVMISARGTAYGNNTTKCISIFNPGNRGIIFDDVFVQCLQAPSGFRLIDFTHSGALNLSNVRFRNSRLTNRQSTAFTSAGNSICVFGATEMAIIDTYAEKPTAGSVTNLITAGNGFMVDPAAI